MSQGVPELTPAQLLDQPWIKRGARFAAYVIALLLTFGGGAVTTYFMSLNTRITTIEKDRATRTVNLDNTVKTFVGQISDLQNDVASIRNDLVSVKTDAATSRGILQEMQRHDMMSGMAPRSSDLRLSGFP